MPDWAMQLLVAGGGLGMLGAMVKAWWSSRRDDREREDKRRQDEADRLRAEARQAWEKVGELQKRFESLLMDAAARAQDDKREKAELIAILAKLHELSSAMVEALKENTKARSKEVA